MAKRILLSFKETQIDQELLRHLEKYCKIVGPSGYVKQLLYEDMIKKQNEKK